MSGKRHRSRTTNWQKGKFYVTGQLALVAALVLIGLSGAFSPVRHSNFIERTFGETRRRVKVIGRLPGEHSCLSLVWAVLDRAAAGWRGFTMTSAALRLLAELRLSRTGLPAPSRDDSVTPGTGPGPKAAAGA